MLIFTILWVVLAATAVVLATMRKTLVPTQPEGASQPRQSGRVLTALAVIYGMTLLVGFIYVSKFLVSTL